MFCDSAEINKISIVAPRGEDFISEILVKNKKISLHALQVLIRPINFSNILRVFYNFLSLVKLYKENDIILLFSLPSSNFFFKIPIGGLYFIFLLIKFNFLSRKVVQVVHDFIPYVYPDDAECSERMIKVLNVYKKYFLGIPNKYIAVSQATKMDAEKFWHIPADKIDVVHHGSFTNSKTPRSRFGSNQVLIVSDISPRKNHIRLIEAFEIVHKQNPNAELIIVGKSRTHVRKFELILQDIKERNKGIKIAVSGYLSDEELLSLYTSVDVFIYPSLYEGFGLPALEAMAAGCPVIVSNVSSLPEIVGDAAILVDPYSIDDLAQAMVTVLQDMDLKIHMSKKGVEQAKKFTWEGAANSYLHIFKSVLSQLRQP
jgi:glycosyltransferase involved in cell wall biosynthesis